MGDPGSWARVRLGDAVVAGWEHLSRWGAIRSGSGRARRFAAFGSDSTICFPPAVLFGEQGIRIGSDTVLGPGISLTAGMAPGQELLSDSIVTIGDRCVIGRNSSIVAHFQVHIGNDVYTGPRVYITDQNHDWVDLDLPIGRQVRDERPVRIGSGSWLGAGAVVLPGVTIGEHAVVGAGSVVTRDVPSRSVVVGNPARVAQRWTPDGGWSGAGTRG